MSPHRPEKILVAGDVERALQEDVGSGDLTASLIMEDTRSSAKIVCREACILAGRPWFEEVFRQLDEAVLIEWFAEDGQPLKSADHVCRITGPGRPIVTGERTALNFLQSLSGTATVTRRFVDLIASANTTILDTRKTVPGLRAAQKYAVLCGGGQNHRMGLFDAVLIKENHIAAAGSITQAIANIREHHAVPIEVEVEDLQELNEALSAQADIVLLDNFDLSDIRKAVGLTAGRAKLEVSGGVDEKTLLDIAQTGVDYVSIGALTKHIKAIDFSMRFANI
ncbi:MAG: carboxylating nicotinate-nucleotide diphosphorylase [Pseudomonadota bacterium]